MGVPVRHLWTVVSVYTGTVADTEFTLDSATALLESLRPDLDELVRLRADISDIAAALRTASSSPLGGRPELKAGEARIDEILSAVAAAGVEIKGVAPLLLDFPAMLDGEPTLLCWLEGEPTIGWHHRPDVGFASRRPLP
jgi:hypothetical protein